MLHPLFELFHLPFIRIRKHSVEQQCFGSTFFSIFLDLMIGLLIAVLELRDVLIFLRSASLLGRHFHLLH